MQPGRFYTNIFRTHGDNWNKKIIHMSRQIMKEIIGEIPEMIHYNWSKTTSS